jgi:hypothetical protein
VAVGELEVSGATFLWRRNFLGTCHLESSEMDDRDHEQARHNFSGEATRGCCAKLFEKLIELLPTAPTCAWTNRILARLEPRAFRSCERVYDMELRN